MKKLLLLLLLTTTFNFFGQTISPLSNGCFGNPFDLTSKNPELLNGQSPNDFTITFYLTLSDATLLLNPTANPNSFVGANNQTIFVNVLNNLTTISVVKSFVLLEPTGLLLTISVVSPISCINNSGSIQAISSGGSGNYNYTISDQGGMSPISNSSGLFNNLTLGNYTVTVVDSNGCQVSENINILSPPPLFASTLASVNNVTILASGGSSPYQYSIDGTLFQNNPTFTGLFPNVEYIYFVRDSNGCTISGMVSLLTCNFTLSVASTLDIPISTYIISINSPSTTGLYNYTLDGGQSIIVPFPSPFTINIPTLGLSFGTHIVAVTDQSTQCTQNISFTIVPFNRLTGSAISTYVDSNNDGFTNVGDTINYQFTINNTSTADAVNVNLLPNNPALTISGNPIVNLAVNAIDTSTFTGVYVLNQNDINQGSVILNVDLVANSLVSINNIINLNKTLNITDGIKLNAFIDTNSNGIQDGTEQNFSLGSFTTQLNSGMIHNITSSSGAYYLYETNPTNLYNFTFAVNSAFASQYSVATASYNNVSVASGSGITTLNFPVSVIPYNDLEVHLYGEAPRPGFTYYNVINYKNNGNTSIPSGTVTFAKNNVVSILNISQSGTINNANGFTYDFTNLQPYETRQIVVTMQVPVIPTVSLGQQLTNSASITIPTSDVNVANNNFNLTQTIVGSFDPNDKTESHGGKILRSGFTANDYLTYKIQFENTGTANAITVKVTDVLDNLLDENSIKMVASSHNYTLDRTGKNLEWKFAAINLPPSVTNTQIGHGYLVFQIKPKPSIVVGDIIPNFASIYFDFNPAIVTETCNTEFVAALANQNFAFNTLKVYPNPVTNILNIDNKEIINNLEVSNILGQNVLSQKVDNLQTKIDLSGLTNGVYFVKVIVGESEKVLKVIKK